MGRVVNGSLPDRAGQGAQCLQPLKILEILVSRSVMVQTTRLQAKHILRCREATCHSGEAYPRTPIREPEIQEHHPDSGFSVFDLELRTLNFDPVLPWIGPISDNSKNDHISIGNENKTIINYP